MEKLDIEPWEPEETVGKLWHVLANRLDPHGTDHEGAAVELTEISGRLAVFFRGLGGDPSVEIRPTRDTVSAHRLALKQRLGSQNEQLSRASFDGEVLRLPEKLAVFPTREVNGALYLWLTAASAHMVAFNDHGDPIKADLAAIHQSILMVNSVCDEFPGLAKLYESLCKCALDLRPRHDLPRWEKAVEALVRKALGDRTPLSDDALFLEKEMATSFGRAAGLAPRGYRPFMPVPLWPDWRPLVLASADRVETPDAETPFEDVQEKTYRAARKKSEQAESKNSLILHKFEAILSWAEFLNLNRRVDDDDNDDAKKAADDLDDLGLGQIDKPTATRLKLHLDLAPEDVDRERISDEFTYPEWDVRSGSYLPDHTRILSAPAPTEGVVAPIDRLAQKRIEAVKRQFEALRPGRIVLPQQPDGEELDLEMAVRAQVELRACGRASERIWRQSRTQARDLAVSILLDASRSTESVVGGRAVIDIEREALTALAWGLQACGDDFAISAFSSLKRDRVYINLCKDFSQPMSQTVEARIGGLKPGFYTRMGAAIRHASFLLSEQNRKRRLLLVLTDGKPNDFDHYEGRHGVEDTRMAVREARNAGQAVFSVTIDAKSKASFTRMFGQGGYSIVSNPAKLVNALPEIYRHLTSA